VTRTAAADFRARVAARRGSADLLVLSLGRERFALPLDVVAEVIDVPDARTLAAAGPLRHALTPYRGALIPVFAAGPLLGVADPAGEAVLVVLRDGGRPLALLADAANAASDVDLGGLCDFPTDGIVIGVLRVSGALVALIDADALAAACRRGAHPLQQASA
jgi:chemotaxis signal transduction protein